MPYYARCIIATQFITLSSVWFDYSAVLFDYSAVLLDQTYSTQAINMPDLSFLGRVLAFMNYGWT